LILRHIFAATTRDVPLEQSRDYQRALSDSWQFRAPRPLAGSRRSVVGLWAYVVVGSAQGRWCSSGCGPVPAGPEPGARSSVLSERLDDPPDVGCRGDAKISGLLISGCTFEKLRGVTSKAGLYIPAREIGERLFAITDTAQA
jgi:hypothetical protein